MKEDMNSKYLNSSMEMLKKTINTDVYARLLAYLIIELIALGVFGLIIFAPLLVYIAGTGLFSGNPQALVSLLSNSGKAAELIGLIIVESIVFLIGMAIINAFFDGARFSYAKSILEKKAKSLSETFSEAKRRAIQIIGVRVLWGIINAGIMLVLFSLVLVMILGSIPPSQGMTQQAAMGAIAAMAMFAVMFFLWIIIMLLISPYIHMAVPVALFERKSIIDSFKKGIELVRGKWLPNMICLSVVGIIIWIVSFLISLFANGFSNLLMIGATAGGAVAALAAVLLMRTIASLLIQAWSTSYGLLAVTQLYTLNSGKPDSANTAPAKRKAKKPRAVQRKPKKKTKKNKNTGKRKSKRKT